MEIDAALEAFGFAMGPFAVADMSGFDIAWRMRKSQAATRDPKARYIDIPDRLCDQGRFGREDGKRVCQYPSGAKAPTEDAVVARVIEESRAAKEIVARPLSTEEIQRRALLAMVNEAALLAPRCRQQGG